MTAEDINNAFDDGEDISKHLDIARANRPGEEQKRVEIDLPIWMINALDKESGRLGIPRHSLIEKIIGKYLD